MSVVPRTNPDIEQQLAEFAPSQSPQEPTLDSVATAVAGTANVPVVPQPFVGMLAVDDSDDANDNAARKVANQQRESVTASLATASRVDPNLAAEADKLGKRFGVGQDIALRNIDTLRNRARLEDANVADLVKTDPVLARMLADPAFASQASDDIGVLRILNGIKNEFERLRPPLPSTSGIGLAVAGGPIGILPALNLYAAEAVKHTATTAWDIVGLGFERGKAVAERGDIGAMEMAGLGSPAALDKAEYLQKRMQEIGQLGLVGSAAEMFGQNVANAKIIGTSAVIGALIGSPGGPMGMATGGAYGASTGIVISTAKMEAGNLYLDLRAEGVPDSTAIPAAIIGGTINGFIELIGFKIAAAPFKKLLSEAIKKELTKQLKTATGRAAIKAAGKAYGVQVLAEGLEEGTQETVIITAEEVSKRISGIHSDTTLGQAAERIVESFLYGTMASALLGGIGPGANLIVDLNRAKVASREQVALTALENNKAESKLADRNLPLYLQLLEAQLNGTPLETIYIEAEVLRDVLEKNEVTLAQLEELFPGIGEQFKKAVDTSGDLTIPTAEYVAKLSGTPLGNALRPHIRGSAESMSATEAIKFEAKREATLAQAKQLLAEQQAINENFEMGALQVEQQAFEQVMATGQYSEQEARAIAQLRAASVVVDAVAQGMTPMEWQMKYGKPLSVRGEGIQAPTAPMEQPDQFDQAGQRKTDTPEFREWNERPTEQGGTNKLVDEQGQPLRFYHGTSRGGFTQFDSAFLGTGAGYSRGGFSFVTSREQAEAYAERASEDTRIVESMLAELNPLFREQGMYERFAAAGIEAGVFDEESKEPAYWDSANVDEGSEQLYDQLDDWLVELRKVGDRDLVLRLGAIRDIGRPTAEPQVYEVYLYAGQQVREFNATPETIGDVLAGIDVRSQPGGAVIVNMSNGDKVVIVSDLTNIKSTDNRGTWSRATPNIFEQATRLPRVDGVALRRAMNQYIRNEIYARELIEEVNLFGLVTEEEVDDLLDQDAKDRVAGVSSRGGGATSIPGEMGRRGQHPLLALVRQREKERPTDIERRNALYLDAVQRGDMETAQRMVDEAARAAGYDRRGYHGLASGQLRGGEFDVGKLGSNTNAPSAKLGFFFSTRRQARTAEAYAYDIDADKAREYATMFQDLANELKARVPKKYHKELVSSLQGELERGKDAFFPITDVDEVTGEPIARSAAEYYGILSDAGLFALEDVLRIVDMMGYAGGVVKSERGSELETWAEKTWLKEWQKLAARASKQAKGTKSSIFTAALRAVNPLVHDYKGKSYREESYASVIARAKQLGHDSVILRNTYDGGGLDDIVVVFDPSQIKSADPVTYDEAGNIVPLSRRFDITSPKVFEQADKPAPDVGIFDVNNPPAPTSARQDIKYGGPVVAVMDYDGKVYYDRNAEMHGDLLDTFPDLDPAMIIDGGFIIDGKYMPAMSDSGMSVNESDDDELIQRVRDLTERVNTPKPIVFEQAARPTRELGPIEIERRNALYLDAVQRGDMETAQRMVDEAARSVGLTELVWRGDRAGAAITQYRRGARREPGIFTTTTQEIADKYAGGVGLARQFYVGGRTLDLTTPTAETVQWIRQWAADAEWDFVDRTTGEQIAPEDAVMSGLLFDWEGTMSGARWKDIQATAAEQGYDIVKLIDMDEQPFVSTVVLNENRIKSADAITSDDAGNIVPLSRRFDITSPRIFEQAAVQRGEPATLERLQMQAQRGVRRQARKVELSPTEEAAIATAASEFGESAAEIREAVLNHKKAHPITQGWAPLEFVKLAPKKIEDRGKKGLGLEKLDLQYRQIPYGFHRDANGKPLQPKTPEYQAAVSSVARRMVDEVRAVAARAAAGDQNAIRIINQSTWYKAMRTALRREFGGLGDLFADLLGATSPNTPVRGNWDFALDVLRRAARGDFDAIITKWEAWVETIERLETDLRAYVNDEQRAMEARGEKVSQAAIQRKPEYIEKFKALKEARNLPDELLPRQENGKKYGFNGGNVVRAMVGLWRTVREQNTLLGTTAQAPKALNFSGNLIGFRARATIDVWAARMLQRLAALLRIPSMAETGVAGEMLPDGSTTGQFGFGQDVFAEAAQRIRNDAELNQNPQLAQLNDDDLQALVWFIEKELWTINNWTSVAGEGGSFELEASLAGISDREMVTQLRKTIDAGVPTKIREAASRLPAAQQAKLNWYLNPAKAGWRQRIDAIRAELNAVPTTLTKKAQRELRAEISERLDAALQKSGFTKLEQALNDAITADMKFAAIEEARKAAQAKLISMERRVDRYTAGLSQQQSLDSQGVDYVPTDADQARLADNVRLRAYRADPGELLVAIKSMPTEGRYGSIERSIDLEVIARQGWSPSELWQVMLEEARDARQESTFLSRVLRADEAIDPARHRPGLEIYFRSPIPRDKLDGLIEKLNANGVDFFTVIVDARRSTAARSGAMADAVGIRMQYVPEFMQRYGIEDFSGLSEADIADRVKAKEAEWLVLADQVLRVMPEVSFAGVFWHETRVAFADAYESEINAITTGTATGDGGLLARTQWSGQSISDGLAAANRFVESRAAQAEPDGGGQVLGGVQEGDRVGLAEPGVGAVFEQAAAGPARGGIDPRTLDIIVRKGADVSTLVHELLHLRIGEYLRMAGSGMATAQVLADLDILFNFMGVDGATAQERLDNYLTMPLEQRRPLEEKATYNFELYVYEGKSPSVELRGVFARLSMWLRRVYKSIRDDLNAIYRREFGTDLPILTPEVRGVFDRMLASEEQIRRQEAVNSMKGLFQTKDEAIAAGMSEAEWAAYQDMQQEATNDAVAQLGAATMRQMQWMSNARARVMRNLQRQHTAKRKEVAAEVSAAIKVTPVYRAMTYLRLGRFVDTDGQEADMGKPHRLDIDQVNAMYAGMPEDARPDIKALGTGKNGMLEKGGLSPDVVAELFGYSSGDEMIRAMLAAKPMKDAVAERTDEVMVQRYSDMNSPAAVEAEVQKALHNEARARLVAVELRFLAKATQPVRLILEAARQVAADIIDGTVIREVRPNQYMAAEARAARDADRIQRTYDITEPAEELVQRYGRERALALVRAKQAQLYQNQLAAEALRVKDYVDKQVKYLRRVLRDENVKRMGAAAADQIAGLLERFEVVSVSLKRLDERRTMAKYLADLEAAGMVPDIAENIADEARRVNYRQMKVSEFRDLVDAVRQIEHVGKNEQKMRLAEERAAFAEKRDEIVTRIREVGKERELQIDPRTPLTGIGRTAAFLRGFAAQHLKAASIARILDGGKEDGPLWNAIIRTANDASDMETRMRAEASKKLGEILKPVFALGGMGGKGIFFPSIGRSLNREARLAIALNMGNDGNRQRLLDGEGWTLEQLQPVLESLTEAEWLAVQQVWDFIDGYRPEIAAKERRLYGKEPEWVKPVPFTVRTVDGKEVSLQGGYYPIKYDPVASDRVATVDAVEEAKRDLQGAYTAATTRRSFVKARAKEVVDRPLLYTLDAAFSGVNDVIHDLAWHEWLIGTNRLLRDTEFANAVRETRGPEFLKQLRDWAKDNATGARGQQAAGESVLSWLRQGISASGLGFNVVSAAMQVTGFNQSIVRVGAKYIGQGIVQFSTSPFESVKTVAEKSSFMAERGRTQFREINEIKNRVRGQTEISRRVFAGTYFLMMNMQRSVDIPTWLGAYQKALDAEKNDATAVSLADQAVRDSQGSGLVSDLAAVERGGPLLKLFTVFYSYMNTVYNMTAVQTMTANSKGKLAADYVMLLVIPVVLGYAIRSAIQPDAGDDELDPEALARKLVAEELSYLMGTMVIVREFGGAAQLLTGAEGVRMGYGGPAGLRAVGEVYGLATQAKQLEFDRAFRRSAINTLGAFTGLPSAQINRTIDGIEALIEGEVEGPTAILAPLTGVQR